MRTKLSLSFAIALLLGSICAAQADQYPPGPGGLYPDTLIKVDFIQNPTATPHPVAPDTVWGIGGIIVGFDPNATGFAIYVQNSQGGPYSGVDVFTGASNYIGNFIPNLALGDSIVAYGRLDEFEGETELRGFANSAFADPLPAVRRITTGNALPPFHRTTANELHELPSNLNAEKWEGCLVRIKDRLRVVRNSDTGGLDNTSAFLAVDQALCPPGMVGPCDTVFVDGLTLASPSVLPPGVSALVDSVQGIFGHRTRGYRIQLRTGADMFGTFPPGLQDAFAIYPDTVRLVFDKNVTQASAENELNYTLSSTLGPPDVALRQPNTPNIVHLKVTNGLAACASEGVTANGLVSVADGATMTISQTRNFRNGICPISSIQEPDPDSIMAVPCVDRSRYAGPGGSTGGRITTRGVCTAVYGSNYFIQTAAGGTRSGLLVFAPTQGLVRGREYVIAGGIQEFFTETELVGTVYIRNIGLLAEPAAVVQTVGVLRDTLCDTPPPTDTGEDYEHMKVQVVNAKITWVGTPPGPGAQFRVAGPLPSIPDTILVDNNIFRTYNPQGGVVTVTGVLDLSFGTWRIQPRGNFDITTHPTLAVGDQDPGAISFAVAPNPARSAYVTFSLPKRDRVMIGIYDLAGRRRTVLVDGEYRAGTHTLEWNGTDSDGKPVGSGMYFYQLKVGDQTFNRTAVLLN